MGQGRGGGGGGSEGRVGGGRLALSPSGPRRKRAEKLLSLNPLGTEGADWLSASNIGRGGGGEGGGNPPLLRRCTAVLIHPWVGGGGYSQRMVRPTAQRSITALVASHPPQAVAGVTWGGRP